MTSNCLSDSAVLGNWYCRHCEGTLDAIQERYWIALGVPSQ